MGDVPIKKIGEGGYERIKKKVATENQYFSVEITKSGTDYKIEFYTKERSEDLQGNLYGAYLMDEKTIGDILKVNRTVPHVSDKFIDRVSGKKTNKVYTKIEAIRQLDSGNRLVSEYSNGRNIASYITDGENIRASQIYSSLGEKQLKNKATI